MVVIGPPPSSLGKFGSISSTTRRRVAAGNQQDLGAGFAQAGQRGGHLGAIDRLDLTDAVEGLVASGEDRIVDRRAGRPVRPAP